MATIGTFRKTDFGFTGLVHTFTFKSRLNLKLIEDSRERGPDYNAEVNDINVGYGWEVKNGKGQPLVTISIDDPSFSKPVNATLIPKGAYYQLVWAR